MQGVSLLAPRRRWPANRPIVFHDVTLTELPKEIFVMRDDDKLKVSVVLPLVNDAADGLA